MSNNRRIVGQQYLEYLELPRYVCLAADRIVVYHLSFHNVEPISHLVELLLLQVHQSMLQTEITDTPVIHTCSHLLKGVVGLCMALIIKLNFPNKLLMTY